MEYLSGQILACLNLHGIGTTLSKELLKDRIMEELIGMEFHNFIKIDGNWS